MDRLGRAGRGFFREPAPQLSFNFNFTGAGEDFAGGYGEPHEAGEPGWQPPLRLPIGESGRPSEAAPVRARRVSAEPPGKQFCDRRARALLENLGVLQPRLIIAPRGLDDAAAAGSKP